MDKTVIDAAQAVDSQHYSPLSARSIIVGWFVAVGIAWLLYVLGLAVGFSAFDVSDADVTQAARPKPYPGPSLRSKCRRS
jgi:hypothetical protein